MAKIKRKDELKLSNELNSKFYAFQFLNLIVGLAAAIVGAGSSAIVKVGADKSIDFIARIHWLIFVTIGMIIYCIVCYVVDRLGRHDGFFGTIFRIPSWAELASFGDQRFAKISYIALAITPFAAFVVAENPFGLISLAKLQLPLNVKISFFIALFFSIALIFFTILSPSEFKQISRKNNLIRNAASESKLEARAFCWLFYVMGLTYSLVLLYRVAIYVANA